MVSFPMMEQIVNEAKTLYLVFEAIVSCNRTDQKPMEKEKPKSGKRLNFCNNNSFLKGIVIPLAP